MSSQTNPQLPSSSKVMFLLALISALVSLFSAAVFLGLGASLALDGTGRYQWVADLAWVGVVLAVLSAGLLVWLTWQQRRARPASVRWGRWLFWWQLLLFLLAVSAVAYGNLRTILYLPLLIGIICMVVLLISPRMTR